MFRGLRAMLAPGGTFFPGWYLVGTSAAVQFLGSLLWMQSFGAYVVLVQQDLGWSTAAFAWAFALARFESGILGPIQGWLVDRFGPRLILSIGMMMFGAGFLLFSRIDSLVGFYLTFGLIAVGSSLGGFATLMVSLVNWFQRFRSTAVAVSQMGYALGGICLPLLTLILEAYGWRTTAWVSGLMVLIVGLPLVQTIRHRPAEIGARVDGLAEPRKASAAVTAISFSARQALATTAFWLISAGHAIALLAVAAMLLHLVPYLTSERGYSLGEASLVVTAVTAFQILGQLSGGFLGDRFSKRWLCTLCMGLHSLALLTLAQATSPGAIAAFALLHGLAWGSRGPQMIALRADYFGAGAFGTILGFSSLIVMCGTMAGPVIVAYAAQTSGGYALGFELLAGACLVGAACFAFATAPAPPEPIRQA